MVSLLPLPNDRDNMVWFIMVYIFGPIFGAIIPISFMDGSINYDINYIMHTSHTLLELLRLILCGALVALPTIINHIVLLITATISYNYPSRLSTDAVMIIFSVIGATPLGVIGIILVLGILHTICIFVKWIWSKIDCNLSAFVYTTSTTIKTRQLDDNVVVSNV